MYTKIGLVYIISASFALPAPPSIDLGGNTKQPVVDRVRDPGTTARASAESGPFRLAINDVLEGLDGLTGARSSKSARQPTMDHRAGVLITYDLHDAQKLRINPPES